MIQRAAETGDVDFLALVNLEMLFSEAVRWMLRLSADEANKKYIENLNLLIEAVLQAQSEAQQQPEAAPALNSVPQAPAEGMPV